MRHVAILLGMLLPAALFAGPATDRSWPRITILRMAAPVLDGTLAPGEWDGAVPLSGFTRLPGGDLIANQPLVKAAWSDEGLMVAAQVPLPPGQLAKARVTDFDGTVWEDDCVEVHLDRGHAHQKNYQFIVNALGTRFDALGGDRAFSAEWQAAAVNQPGQWSCELLIPWEAMGGAPSAGDLDGFNVIVNSSYLGGTLTLSPITRSAHETARYLHLVYGEGAAVAIEGLDANAPQGVRVRALGRGEATLTYVLSSSEAGALTEIERRTLTLRAPAEEPLPIQVPEEQGMPRPGTYVAQYTAEGPDGLLLVRSATLTVASPLGLTAQAFLGEGYLDVILQPLGLIFPPADTTLHLTATVGATTLYDQDVPPAESGPTTVKLTDVPAGTLTLVAGATNRVTGKQYRTERSFDSPLHPVWLGTQEGLSDEVPAPWTALRVEGANTARPAVRCWGRRYGFAQGLLPSAVMTREAEVLQAPIALTGRADGQPLEWSGERARVESARPDIVTLSGGGTSVPFTISGTTRVEFDGMIRCDLTLTPTRPGVTVQELTLEVPVKPEHARYLYHFPGRWGSVANSAYLPKEGWSNAFRPFIWLGDEDRGFSWFCESDRNWFPLDNPAALTIEREQQATVLRCHLIAEETQVNEPLTYTFGFQATPVKQPEKTVWDYRITHHGNYGLEQQRATAGGRISYPAAGHVRREEGTFECWYRPAVDSERDRPFEQRRYQGNRSIFTVELSPGANGTNYGLYWNGTVQGLVGWARTDGVVTDNPGYAFDWKGGEWHHIALTWDPEHLRIYLDGRMVSETPNNGFLAGPLEDARIYIGGDGALATIDEVRILGVARAPVVIDKPFEPDADTLLLDHFDDYTQEGAKPVGTAEAGVSFGPGKWGLAPTWEPQAERMRLDELADFGVRTICFHEHWVPYQSYPHVTDADRPRLHSLVEGIHAHDMNLLLYMSRQFADNAPEWELYHGDFLIEPRSGAYTRQPPQRAYIGCWKGPFREFALYWLGQTIDEFGHDGWYLDGPEWPQQCTNRHHGCGYVAPDGSVRPTWDLFATREFMRRLYVLTRQRKPEGQLNIHNSTVMVIPTLAWGTSTWGGEQIDAIKPPVETLDILPMDSFRTEFMGRQWGIPAEFLVYDGQPYYARDVLAYTLLHGVVIRPGSAELLERVSALWRVHDEFPFSHGEMKGYWMNRDLVRIAGSPSGTLECGPPAVYASVWQLPRRGSLIVVSNLTHKDTEARLTLNLDELGAGPNRVWDALSGETLSVERGTLRLPVASWRYRVLRVQ